MLTRIRGRNFKKLNDVDVELGKAVVLIGPNNSGKTSALQALEREKKEAAPSSVGQK